MPKNKISMIKKEDCLSIEHFQLKNIDFFGKNIWTAKEICKFITSPKNHLLMAKINNQLVGISFFISNSIDLEIYTIFVEKDFRKRNIGTNFLASAKEFCRSMPFKRILLEVNEENKNALKFYAKNNFKQIGFKKGYYTSKNNENALLMELGL